MAQSRQGAGRRFRRFVMAMLDAALLRGAIARWSFGHGLHGTLETTAFEIRIRGLRVASDALRIAFASDFHAGATTDPRLFCALMELLVAQQPDVLLLGGDFVSWNAQDIRVLADCFAAFDPPLGKYAVMGNHDTWAGVEQLMPHLSRAGVEVLVNRHVSLAAPFEHVSICGIDDPWTGSPDVARAFEGAGPVRIFLTHSPDGILLVDENRFDVALAGHTHGGQIALADGTPLVTAGGPLSRSHSRGQFAVAGNGTLFVSRGIGCSNLPLRIHSDPELVMCTLRFGGE